ncbi:MAG: PTS sugar transporter subunit IIC [Clostridiales bacterium]|nr:PTS sugar transporter subunit IIC [Clostridiales bacterium]
MEITIVQGFGLALLALAVGIDFRLETFFAFRPIIVCTLAGLILGELQLGLVVGGMTKLAFAGLTPAGDTQPPNPIIAGIRGGFLAYISPSHLPGALGTGVAQATAAAALPFRFLMRQIVLLCCL